VAKNTFKKILYTSCTVYTNLNGAVVLIDFDAQLAAGGEIVRLGNVALKKRSATHSGYRLEAILCP
jgi:hypothetical protein